MTKKLPTRQEMMDFLKGIRDARDRILVELLYETGCNIREIVRLKVLDVKKDHVILGRGRRKSLISTRLAEDITMFIRGNRLTADDCLIRTRQSDSISEKRASQIVVELTAKAGLPAHNAHAFRYWHVAHAYLEGVYQENIADQTGLKVHRIFQIIRSARLPRLANLYPRFFT